MGQRWVFAAAGALAIVATGCASEPTTTAPTTPAPTAATPVAPSPGASPAAQPFAKPLLAQKPATPAVPGLIQPTNPDERARQVQASIAAQKGQKDPFSNVPITLQRPNTPKVVGVNSGGASSQRQPAKSPQGGLSSKPNQKPNRAKAPFTPPPPPSTNLANAVEVSGVVYVNGKAQAIVRAPQEGTSRYVAVGQRLSGGQVLVKRIQMNAGSDPVVVLEENGVEVSKIVGERVAAPQVPAGAAPG